MESSVMIQLIGVREDVAIVQKNNDEPIEITHLLLMEAQQQQGEAGHVYRYLMREYCRCSLLASLGRAWQSPRRELAEIVADEINRQILAAKRKEDEEREIQEKKEIEDRRKEREQEIRCVEQERRTTSVNDPWWPIPSFDIPDGVRFDTPLRNQGQIVEVSYGTFGRFEACSSDPYMRVTDHSLRGSREPGHQRFYKRRPTQK